MKRNFNFIIILIVLVFAGCKKEEANPSLNDLIIGRWEYIKTVGGFTGTQVILPPAGSKYVLNFTSENKYSRFLNGQVTEAGTYDLVKVKSIFNNAEDDGIRFNHETASTADFLINIKNDSLWISDNHVEPYGYLYVREVVNQ